MADDARLPLRQSRDADPITGPLRLSDAEYDMLHDMGVLDRLGRVELRGGELWRMSPIFLPHANMRETIADALKPIVKGIGLLLVQEVTVKFPQYYPNPDIVVFAQTASRKQIPAEDVRLIIEVSDTTLADDLGDKKSRYAAAGLSEYWVVDMPHAQVLRFYAPQAGQFQAAEPVPAGAPCQSLTLEGVTLSTADWPWDAGEE